MFQSAVLVDAWVKLDGTGGLEYEGARFAMLAETRNDRQRKRGSFTCAGLGRTDDIASIER